MRVLIAIMSCARDVMNGANESIRETWLTWMDRIPAGWDYRFFVGIGNPPPLADETEGFQNQYRHLASRRPTAVDLPPTLSIPLKEDEIALDVADSYAYLVHKVRASRAWAAEQGYDYIFKVDTDTFVIPPRLVSSGFESHDYIGARFALTGPEDVYLRKVMDNYKQGHYTQGGPGYWLSRRAYERTIMAPIVSLCEDVWTGVTLHAQGIQPHNDSRYEWGRVRNPARVVSVVNLNDHQPGWMKSMFHSYRQMLDSSQEKFSPELPTFSNIRFEDVDRSKMEYRLVKVNVHGRPTMVWDWVKK